MQAVSSIHNLNSLSSSRYNSTKKNQESETPTAQKQVVDSYTPSGNAPAQSGHKKTLEEVLSTQTQDTENGETEATTKSTASHDVQDFNLDDFRAQIRAQLLDQIKKAKDNTKESNTPVDWTSDIPYSVDPSVEAAAVPDEWNSDNTSQRIVDFALQFREAAKQSGMTDEEFINQIRGAIQEGFRLAKSDLQELPSASAKLFNDTYQATMDKLDKALASWQSESTTTTVSSNS